MGEGDWKTGEDVRMAASMADVVGGQVQRGRATSSLAELAGSVGTSRVSTGPLVAWGSTPSPPMGKGGNVLAAERGEGGCEGEGPRVHESSHHFIPGGDPREPLNSMSFLSCLGRGASERVWGKGTAEKTVRLC